MLNVNKSQLATGGLHLYIRRDGNFVDAESVTWTILTESGVQISAAGISAVRKSTGSYYAPWTTQSSNNIYKIQWKIYDSCGTNGTPAEITQTFSIVDDYDCIPIICTPDTNPFAVPCPQYPLPPCPPHRSCGQCAPCACSCCSS